MLTMLLGENVANNTQERFHYRLVNNEEKVRIKNNDKSIAALEGKNLLYDSPKENNVNYMDKKWKNHKEMSDYYKRKVMLRDKMSKLGFKELSKPDKSLGG